jgi:hypothetical protein
VIHTNDSAHAVVELLVSGKVELFAEIRPRSLRLAGPAGRTLSAAAEIVPRPDQPFTIRSARTYSGRNLQLNLSDKVQDGRKVYALTVTGSSMGPERFNDFIILETDSRIRPTLQIPVYGIVTPPEAKPAQ